MKRAIVLLVAIVFTLSIISIGFAAAAKVEGTVTKIEGKKVTVKDDKGKETTVEVKDLGGAKVGDKVKIEDGKVTVMKTEKKPAEKKPAAGGY